MGSTWIVIPVFNEISRGSSEYWKVLSSNVEAKFVFVDDCSTDSTGDYLDSISRSMGVHVIRHTRNQGKGEAIRSGFNYCMSENDNDNGLVALLDADGAFTADEVNRILKICKEKILDGTYDSIWTSRVKMAGRTIDRNKFRHLSGRIISTILGTADATLPYDTQSGFKIFKITDNLAKAMNAPFLTHWLFDIELLLRLKRLGKEFKVREEALEEWHEIGNSTIKPRNYLQIVKEVLVVIKELKRGS
jgi:glycosyltransferase involved in cell wall biosynthesis